MKLRFEPDLPHQAAAIAAVSDLFKGQELGRTEFTVTRTSPESAQGELGLDESALGVGNRLTLLEDELTGNLRAVQLRGALKPTEAELKKGGFDFTVEMETGTGKTYVYLRTVFELNRLYGFTKFIIVTPSVAIREGVAKTLEMTADHFRALYAGVPMDWFVYDSAKLGQVRDFAASSTIKIMVATIGALNKLDTNVFYQPHERTGGEKPVDLVRSTRPVIIIDEPQSVEGGKQGAGARALREMGALCRLRYSATHVDRHEMIYRLDAVDAYQAKLVKRVDVAGLEITNADNAPYVKLLEVRTARGKPPQAKVEVGLQQKGGVNRDNRWVSDGQDLEELTGRSVYAGVSIGTIEGGDRTPLVQLNLPGDTVYLGLNQAHGDVDRTAVVRHMIRRTIREHFEREKALKPLGIKVLSLFFIDRVASYRVYEDGGATTLGSYGVIFEDEYRKLAAHPDFRETIFAGRQPEPERAHDGYFSQDKKGRVTEPEVNASGELKNAASRDDAERGFRLIMRDKERLLDEAEPLRFIFSHSALREGWDNPNVFQICVLREMAGERERRQTIGRGLRLCVDANGERRRDEGLNVLTVIADESYADFAAGLQADIARDLEIRFGVVERETFATLPVVGEDGEVRPLGVEASTALYNHLRAENLIDARGCIEDELRRQLKAGTLQLPAEFDMVAAAARELLAKLAVRLEVRNADDRKKVSLNKQVALGEDFKALWDRIKWRTTYRVDFDAEDLVRKATKSLAEAPHVLRAHARFVKAEMQVDAAGVRGVRETSTPFQHLTPETMPLPDVLGELQNRTQLTRRSLARIVTGSGRLDDLRANPAAFLDQAAELINRAKRAALVDGVIYRQLPPEDAFAQELFGFEEMERYLSRLLPVKRAVTDHIEFDSEVERAFAKELDDDTSVKVFAKLPSWFKVPTPLGDYNPDWAVLVSQDGAERLYLVVETKGTVFLEDLRASEADRIRCGTKHFAELARETGQPRYLQAKTAAAMLAGLVERKL